MKQSSIDWLRSLYENRPAYEECILDEEWEQAKAMHKEEIDNLPIHIHEGIENIWVYIENGIVHVEPNTKINEKQ